MPRETGRESIIFLSDMSEIIENVFVAKFYVMIFTAVNESVTILY